MKPFAPSLLVLLCACAVLPGCQTSNPLPVDHYNKLIERPLPPVTIFALKPSDELEKLCEEKACMQGPQLIEGIFEELRQSHMFDSVNGSRTQNDYQIHIVARRISPQDLKETAKVIVASATLMVVPVTMSHEYRSEIVVAWRNIPLAQYSFSIPYDEQVSIFKDFRQSIGFASESIAARFIAHAQREDIFSTPHLYRTLQAENYPQDMRVPAWIGDYAHVGTHIYPDPMLGAQLRFQHNGREDVTDAFVYPIRRVEWSDADKTLREEMDAVRQETGLAIKAGIYAAAEFGPDQPFTFVHEGKTYRGQRAGGFVTRPDGNRVASWIYLFTLKDKFVKFRVTRPDANTDNADIDTFVTALIPQMVVPDESLFMAKLRQQTRQSTIQ